MTTHINSLTQSNERQESTLDKTSETTASNSTERIIMHHLSSFQNNNLEAMMSDYTDESVLVTQEETYTGHEQIKVFFANLITHFPKQKSSLNLDKMVVIDRLGYIVWYADTPSLAVFLGTHTFVIKDDKINQQTFCGQMKFK